MALYMNKTIWVATDYDIAEPIAASPCFEDILDLLYADHYLQPQETKIKIHNEWKTLEEAFGPDWLHILKKFSAARLNVILDWNVALKQIEFYETIKNVYIAP